MLFLFGERKRPGGRRQHFSRSVTASFLCYASLQMVSWYCMAFILCEVSVHMFVHVCIQAKNSNCTIMGMLWNFNLSRGHGTLLLIPFPITLTSLCLAGQVPLFQKEHCCWVFDFSKAFESIPHTFILRALSSTPLRKPADDYLTPITRWLYL